MKALYIIDDITENIRHINSLQHNIKNQLGELIHTLVGEKGSIVFTNETSYPIFNDDADDCLQSVIAVRVVWNHSIDIWEIEFNTDCNGWFRPSDYGHFNYSNLFDCINAWINCNSTIN